jgi:hypothetical protein
MSYLGKIVKNTAIMFAVGVVLALAVPPILAPIATYFGATAPSVSVLWNGLFFGGFGGIHAAIEPIINAFVGDKPRHPLEEKAIRTSPAIAISAPGHAADLAPEVQMDAPATNFRERFAPMHDARISQVEKLTASRAATPQEQSI